MKLPPLAKKVGTALAGYLRPIRFFLFQWVVLPIGILPMRLLVRSWRTRGPDPSVFGDAMRHPRVVLLTYHGMFLHLLAFSKLPPSYGRRLVVLLSPSWDGRLLGAALKYFGIDHVHGSINGRAVAGSLEFIKRIEAGDVGVVAADGPRGPCAAAKAGFLRIAAAANAHLLLTATAADKGVVFDSWDRAHLPAPLSRVEVSIRLLPPPSLEDPDRVLPEVQETMLEISRRIGSPVLPESLRAPSPFAEARVGLAGDVTRE